MRFAVMCAMCAASSLALGGAAKADTFTLSNTSHPDCHAEFPGLDAGFDCSTLAGNGSFVVDGAGFILTGPDLFDPAPLVDPNTVRLTAIADADKILVYSFDYVSQDDASSMFDPAGYFINGVDTQVTALTLPFVHQTGKLLLDLKAGDSYGFFVSSTDSAAGAGIFGVQPSVADRGVPEPDTWALLVLGFGAMGAMRRRQRSAAA